MSVGSVDLADVARAAFDAVRPLAATKHVHLTLDVAAGSRTVSGDDARLQQVIWSPGVGQGATFTVRLPIATGEVEDRSRA